MNSLKSLTLTAALLFMAACNSDSAVSPDEAAHQDDSASLQLDQCETNSAVRQVIEQIRYSPDGTWRINLGSDFNGVSNKIADEAVKSPAQPRFPTQSVQLSSGDSTKLQPPEVRSNVILLAGAAWTLAAAAFKVWTWAEIIKACVPPLVNYYVSKSTIDTRTVDACLTTAAKSAAGRAVSVRLIPSVRVNSLRTELYNRFAGVITQRRLKEIFSRQTKPSITKVAQGMVDLMFGQFSSGVESALGKFR